MGEKASSEQQCSGMAEGKTDATPVQDNTKSAVEKVAGVQKEEIVQKTPSSPQKPKHNMGKSGSPAKKNPWTKNRSASSNGSENRADTSPLQTSVPSTKGIKIPKDQVSIT